MKSNKTLPKNLAATTKLILSIRIELFEVVCEKKLAKPMVLNIATVLVDTFTIVTVLQVIYRYSAFKSVSGYLKYGY